MHDPESAPQDCIKDPEACHQVLEHSPVLVLAFSTVLGLPCTVGQVLHALARTSSMDMSGPACMQQFMLSCCCRQWSIRSGKCPDLHRERVSGICSSDACKLAMPLDQDDPSKSSHSGFECNFQQLVDGTVCDSQILHCKSTGMPDS
eukprot:133367-Amphidinium_carterae.1